jgi:hypothetical protein
MAEFTESFNDMRESKHIAEAHGESANAMAAP